MKTIERASGLKIILPSEYQVNEAAPPPSDKRRRRAGRVFGPVPLPQAEGEAYAVNDALAAAFGRQDMLLLDRIELDPSAVRRAARSAPKLELTLEPYEDAVVLLEQEGAYAWHFPDKITTRKGRPARRGLPAVAEQRIIQFELALGGRPSAQPGETLRRGVLEDLVLDKVRAYVFKFAARIAVGQALKYLERNVRRGLVNMSSAEDPAKWDLLEAAPIQLPKKRPARILLFVHGTFSSTIGGFGPLLATQWGREFMRVALSNYDAVLGFDHATLSEDPLENATDLLKRLQAIQWPHPPRFDVITHSRGGLVARSLLEHLLPLSDFKASFERVIFVAVTNGGTKLAEPDNWQTLLDLYTNLSMAACRLIGMMPQAKAVTTILNEVIQGLGALVKYCVTTAIDERNAPGLAAMEPDGRFIRALNAEQPGQPSIEKSYYCAVTSDFETRLLGGEHEPTEMPPRFLMWTAQALVGQLMKEPNDLVVNTASMTSVDPQLGRYIKDSLDFGSNPLVYHTNYFVQPEVVNAFARWLALVDLPKKPSRRRPKSGDAGGLYPYRVPPGGMSNLDVPAAVDTDIFVTDAATPLGETIHAILNETPSYVIVSRDYQGDTLNYAFSTEEVMEKQKWHDGQSPLFDALNLHETDRSVTIDLGGDLRLPGLPGDSVTAGRGVVVSGAQPIGVLRSEFSPASGAKLVDLTRIVSKPRTHHERFVARRTMPSFAAPPVFEAAFDEAAPAADKSAPAITCHFRAEMDQEVLVKRPATIEVLVSREVIGQALHAAAAEGRAEIDPSRKLYVQVLPKVNFESLDEGWTEIDPPAPGEPQQLYFLVRATDPGNGEVWVIARQGQVPLVTLVLKAQIVRTRGAARSRSVANAVTPEAAPLSAPLHQLFITEQYNGKKLSYRFQLIAPDLKVFEWDFSKSLDGDRVKYVEKLYEEIEQRWLGSSEDVDNFVQELRAFGAQLLDELVPPKVQAALWQHRSQIASIMVVSEEPFIPWELVHLKQPGEALPAEMCFLGQMGLVRWLADAGWPTETLQIRPGKAHYLIPAYPHPDYELPEAQREAAFLADKFGAAAIQPKASALRKLLSTAGAVDLLHFAGHGVADVQNIANAQLMMEGRVEGTNYVPEYFSSTSVEQHANLSDGRNAPLVVLNACQAGRAGYKLTGIGGFAQAFLKRKAGAFVSTLWSVGDSPALSFTEEFYAQLLKGAPLSLAAIHAREKARKAGDATWLAYVVYGHPHARLK
ncbi:MAG: DUF7379 domain-containing protein [Chloroflexota bacterium]